MSNSLDTDHCAHQSVARAIGANNDSCESRSNTTESMEAIPNTGVEPIAIVGMATRLPGGVRDAESFWDILINKKDVRSRIPSERFNVDSYYSKSGGPGTIATDSGYFLQGIDLRDFDAGFFNMSRTEIERLDPQQRLLLEVTWECLENAGQKDWRGRNIGCFVGNFGEDWLDTQTLDPQETGLYRVTGHGDYAISNRISYEFDFRGPSMTIKTACSSSLVAIHEACAAIRNGDCETAIVGGTSSALDGWGSAPLSRIHNRPI